MFANGTLLTNTDSEVLFLKHLAARALQRAKSVILPAGGGRGARSSVPYGS